MLAPCFAAVVFCVMGSSMGGGRSDYYFLLAIVFAPVAFIWCNAGRYLINRISEGIGWVVLFFFWVIGIFNH